MTYKPTFEQRIQRKLHRMEHDDTREAANSTPDAIVRAMRARLTEEQPQASVPEIEAQVALRIVEGAKPTMAVVKSAPGIPKDVLAARRAERKQIVARGKHLRR
ncbi:hypothetical protein [Falsiroseomonas sp. E2-1-a20]|uniref:hypothetical protein n=1 Tax=Falsiroseomonas sp. E2-1-a20 TaxID=3239300 RepID=UPI003F2A9686